ncbi:HNH endonuclease [Xanthomonas citri pv. citri]
MDANRLRQLLEYDPSTGVFKWRVSPARQIKVGSVAGGVERTGYRRIRVDGVLYRAARLAWLYVHGEWPSGEVDHINRTRHDDRLANLRDVHHQQNCHNSLSRGAHRSGGRFSAKIMVGGRHVWLGRHATEEAAAAAYHAAKRRLHHGVS